MKAVNQQNLPPNKKLILHFDINGVIRLSSRENKDLYVASHIYLGLWPVFRVGLGSAWKDEQGRSWQSYWVETRKQPAVKDCTRSWSDQLQKISARLR